MNDRIRERYLSLNLEPMEAGEASELEDQMPKQSVYRFSVASEEPVNMGGFREILSHAPGAINLDRLPGMIFMWSHGHDKIGKQPLGKVENWQVQNRKSYVDIRPTLEEYALPFWRNVDRGILTDVSIRYEVISDRQVDNNTILVDKWMPIHTTLCADPADHTVGYNRSLPDSESYKSNLNINEYPAGGKMEDTATIDKKELIKSESLRQREIRAAGENFSKLFDTPKFRELAETFIESDYSVEESRSLFSKEIEKLPANRAIATPQSVPENYLNDKEQKQFSIISMARAMKEGTWDRENSYEREVCQSTARSMGLPSGSLRVPIRSLKIDLSGITGNRQGVRATMNTQTMESAGFLIDTTLAPTMIDYLVNATRMFQLGMQRIGNLQGDYTYPRKTGKSKFYYIGQGQGPNRSRWSGGLLKPQKHSGGVRVAITREMLNQSSMDQEMLARQDMMETYGLEIDRASLIGSGIDGEPLGLFNRVGLPAVRVGTDPSGAAITADLDNVNVINTTGNNGGPMNFDLLIDMVSAVGDANAAYGSRNYITTSKVIGQLQKLRADGATGAYLWNGLMADMAKGVPGAINGYPVAETNQISGTFSKGTATNLHGAVFGNISEIKLLEWGSMIFDANTQGEMWESGGVELKLIVDYDVMVTQAKAFSICKNIAVS